MKNYKHNDAIETFFKMAQVDSESFHETPMVDFLLEEIKRRNWNCKTEVQSVSVKNLPDDLQIPFTQEERQIETKQLVVTIDANDKTKEPIFLCAHIDTVTPGKGIKPVIDENDVIHSDGTTILGSDDKSGVSAILCAVDFVLKNNLPHGKLVLFFVALEERGHVGALHSQAEKYGVNYGYVFDTMYQIGRIVERDQHGQTVRICIKAKEMRNHTAACLSNNSLTAAVDLSAKFTKKFYDKEDMTFAQIVRLDNTYQKGYMVPCQTDVKFVMRSFSNEKLVSMRQEVEKIINEFKMDNIEISYTISPKNTYGFDMTKYNRGQEIMKKAETCIKEMGLDVEYVRDGLGGHDSSIFLQKGICSLVLSSGMRDIHTCNEHVTCKDLSDCCELVVKLIEKA